MRHKIYGKHLGRSKNERRALFRSLIRSLILSEKIETTESKAKAVKGLVDKIINQAKSPNTRRLLGQFLTDKKIIEKLVKEIVPRLKDRSSGYTSLVRMGKRLGDNAMMVRMSLLLEESRIKDQESSKKTIIKKSAAKIKKGTKKLNS